MSELSSMPFVPLTSETRDRLLAAGVGEDAITHLTEMGGQALLSLRADLHDEFDGAPPCYRKEYNPTSPVCGGCVMQPTCWSHDSRYMKLLLAQQAPAPMHVPITIVEERMQQLRGPAATPPPPRRAPKVGAPPPPPPKYTELQNDVPTAFEEVEELQDLGYDPKQIERMRKKTIERIRTEGIEARFVSITKTGEVRFTPSHLPIDPQYGEDQVPSIAESWKPCRVKLPPSFGTGSVDAFMNPEKDPVWRSAEESDSFATLLGMEPAGARAWVELHVGGYGFRVLPVELVTVEGKNLIVKRPHDHELPPPPAPPPRKAAAAAIPPPPPVVRKAAVPPPPPPPRVVKKVMGEPTPRKVKRK